MDWVPFGSALLGAVVGGVATGVGGYLVGRKLNEQQGRIAAQTAVQIRRLEKLQDTLEELFTRIQAAHYEVALWRDRANQQQLQFRFDVREHSELMQRVGSIAECLNAAAFRFSGTKIDALAESSRVEEFLGEMLEKRNEPNAWPRLLRELSLFFIRLGTDVYPLIIGQEEATAEDVRARMESGVAESGPAWRAHRKTLRL